MSQIKTNTVLESQIKGSEPFVRMILAAQEDLVAISNLQQDSLMTEFPTVPEFGGVLTTRKGSYEGVWTDVTPPAVEQPRWRRLSDSTLYEAGDTIPTTL